MNLCDFPQDEILSKIFSTYGVSINKHWAFNHNSQKFHNSINNTRAFSNQQISHISIELIHIVIFTLWTCTSSKTFQPLTWWRAVAMRKYMDYSFSVRGLYHTHIYRHSECFTIHDNALHSPIISIIDQIICTSIPPIRVQETLLAVPCINKWMKWVHLKVHQIILGLKCV